MFDARAVRRRLNGAPEMELRRANDAQRACNAAGRHILSMKAAAAAVCDASLSNVPRRC